MKLSRGRRASRQAAMRYTPGSTQHQTTRLTDAHVPSSKAFSEKNSAKCQMDANRPLFSYEYKSCSLKFVSGTYMLPVRKVIVKPILDLREVWSFQTTGNGKMSITTSVMMFGRLPHRICAWTLLLQWPPGIVLSHAYATGEHCHILRATLTMTALIKTAPTI